MLLWFQIRLRPREHPIEIPSVSDFNASCFNCFCNLELATKPSIFFRNMFVNQRTSPRGTGTRSSERSVPPRRRVARAGVRGAGGRRCTPPKNHLKTKFLFASTLIMFARHLNYDLKLCENRNFSNI